MRKLLGNLILSCLREAETKRRIEDKKGWRNQTVAENVLEFADEVKQIDHNYLELKRKYDKLSRDFFEHETILKQRLLKLEENIPDRTAITAANPVKSKQRSGGRNGKR